MNFRRVLRIFLQCAALLSLSVALFRIGVRAQGSSSTEILFNRSTDGGATFSTPFNVSSLSGCAAYPAIATDSSGAIFAVWSDPTPGSGAIFLRRSTDGGATFSSTSNVSSLSATAAHPAIATDFSGAIFVVWDDVTPGSGAIFLRRSTDGGATFSSTSNVSSLSGTSSYPAIATDSSGAIFVVWDDPTPGNGAIFLRRSTDGGATFSSTSNVSSLSGAPAYPAVATGSSSNIFTVWAATAATTPVVSSSVAVSTLSPLNHNLVNVGLAAEATDSCDSSPTLSVQVFGNEDDQTPTDSNGTVFSPDAADIAPGTLRLRAERSDSGNGRVYLIVATATSTFGNSGFDVRTGDTRWRTMAIRRLATSLSATGRS
jgi:BNR repeat-like domain